MARWRQLHIPVNASYFRGTVDEAVANAVGDDRWRSFYVSTRGKCFSIVDGFYQEQKVSGFAHAATLQPAFGTAPKV